MNTQNNNHNRPLFSNKGNTMLSPVVVNALQNDARLKELYKRINELYSKAIPKVIEVSPTEFKVTYGDEFNKLVTNFQQEINFRQDQIVSFFNR